MDGADVCRTSSRASRRPPDVISTIAILNPRWRRRKWHQPGLGVLFSIPVVAVAQNGGPSASGRHLGWPHLREPEMRSSKMAAGSGRAAILRHRHNGDRKKYPILLSSHKRPVKTQKTPFDDVMAWNTCLCWWDMLHPRHSSMAYCKTAISPLLTHWWYCSLELSHRVDMWIKWTWYAATCLVVIWILMFWKCCEKATAFISNLHIAQPNITTLDMCKYLEWINTHLLIWNNKYVSMV